MRVQVFCYKFLNDISDRRGYRKAVEILEQLIQQRPDVPDYRIELAETLTRVIVPERFDGSLFERLDQDLRRAGQLVDDLIAESGDVPRYHQTAIRILERTALLRMLRDGVAEGLDPLRRAWELQSRLTAPGSRGHRSRYHTQRGAATATISRSLLEKRPPHPRCRRAHLRRLAGRHGTVHLASPR